MILTRSREYTVNMGNYESVKIGGSITVDSEKMAGEDGVEPLPSELQAIVETALDNLLAGDVKEASELTATRDSFILSWKVK